MAHFNEIVVKTAKNRKNTLKAVKVSLAEVYPEYTVQDIVAEGKEWKATLLRELTEEEVIKLASLPFELEEEAGEEDSPSEDEEGEKETSSPASEDNEEGDDEGEPGADEKKSTGTELKDIESLLLELKAEVQKLKEKADVVDTVHDTVKDHVDSVEAPPVAPKPKAPGAPGAGGPLGMGGPAGLAAPKGKPLAASTKIAYASIQQDGFEFSMTEVAEAMQERYPDYRIARIEADVDKNRYVARLELK